MATKKAATTDFSAVTAKISPVAERDSFISALVYGRSGTGKTAFSATFPKPILLLDIKEKGTDTIAKVEDIDVAQIDEWTELEQMYWFLVSGQAKYKTVIVDGGSQMQDLAMAYVRDQNGDTPDSIISKRDWGQISGLMKTWLFNYRDLMDHGMHVCMVFHERSSDANDAIEDQIDPSIGPRLMPSVASAINGAVSFIGNTFIREKFIGAEKVRQVEYGMRIGPHAYYTTKVRKPPEADTPDVIINPTFEKIMAITRGETPAPKKSVKRRA